MSQERVHFRFIVTPCCSTALCYVNPRLPNYCSECGTRIITQVRECIMISDENAWLKINADIKVSL